MQHDHSKDCLLTAPFSALRKPVHHDLTCPAAYPNIMSIAALGSITLEENFAAVAVQVDITVAGYMVAPLCGKSSVMQHMNGATARLVEHDKPPPGYTNQGYLQPYSHV